MFRVQVLFGDNVYEFFASDDVLQCVEWIKGQVESKMLSYDNYRIYCNGTILRIEA